MPGAAHQVLLGTQQQLGSEKDEEASEEILATLVQGLCDLGCRPYPHCYSRAEASLAPRKVQPRGCPTRPMRGPHRVGLNPKRRPEDLFRGHNLTAWL